MRVVTGIEPELRQAVLCRREAGCARTLARLVVCGPLTGDEDTTIALRDTLIGLVSKAPALVDPGIAGRSRLEGGRGPLQRHDEVLVSAEWRGAVAYQHFRVLGFDSHGRPVLTPSVVPDDADILAGAARVH